MLSFYLSLLSDPADKARFAAIYENAALLFNTPRHAAYIRVFFRLHTTIVFPRNVQIKFSDGQASCFYAKSHG